MTKRVRLIESLAVDERRGWNKLSTLLTTLKADTVIVARKRKRKFEITEDVWNGVYIVRRIS